MEFDSALGVARKRAGITFDLKQEQREALHALYHRMDVMCLLPTGFGKSAIFQIAPFLLDSSPTSGISLVVAPLNAIMKDQVLKLCQNGVSACYVDINCEEGETFQLAATDGADGAAEEGWETDDEDDAERLHHIRVSVSCGDLSCGKCNLVYAHPEALLSTTTGMAVSIENGVEEPDFAQKKATRVMECISGSLLLSAPLRKPYLVYLIYLVLVNINSRA